jgi:hypothetical protein
MASFNPYSVRDARALRGATRNDPSEATAGGLGRIERQARISPRDSYHYRDEYGTSLSDEAYGAVKKNEEEFSEYEKNRRAEIAKALDDLKSQSAEARNQLDSSYNSALGKLPGLKDPNSEFNKWKGSWVRFEIKSGIGDSIVIPGGDGAEGQEHPLNYTREVWVPSEAAGKYAEHVNKDPYTKVEGTTITVVEPKMSLFLGPQQSKFRVEKSAANAANVANAVGTEASTMWWKNALPQIEQYNQSVYSAKGSANKAYDEQLKKLQSEVAAAEGQGQGYLQGLEAEIESRKKDLLDIRKNYQSRLDRIAQSLGIDRSAGGSGDLTVGSGERVRSSSPKQPVRQIDPITGSALAGPIASQR